MTNILDGKELAEKFKEEIKDKVSKLDKKPGLAVILVGDDPASHVYVDYKQKDCKDVGMESYKYVFEKPIKLLANAKDVLIAISSSGRSENILRALLGILVSRFLGTVVKFIMISCFGGHFNFLQ